MSDVFFKSLALSVPVIEWPPLGEVLSDFLSNPGIWTARDLLERITANPPPCQVQTSVVSHRGTSRSNNEDCALANEYQVWIEGMPVRAHLLVVADGMGGQGAGEVASRIATQTVDVALHKYINDGGLVLGASNVRNAIELANSEVYEARMGGIGSSDMGTTLSVALLIGRRYYIGVVGDSRVYSISSEGDLCLLSYDHSMAGELYRAGSISFEEADEHPMSSKLTRSIGAKVDVEVDLFSGELKSNEGVLLTTDGFNRAIREFTFPIGSDLDEALDALIVRMLKRDGSDNATAVIVRVG